MESTVLHQVQQLYEVGQLSQRDLFAITMTFPKIAKSQNYPDKPIIYYSLEAGATTDGTTWALAAGVPRMTVIGPPPIRLSISQGEKRLFGERPAYYVGYILPFITA
jgi:hypothetical protein